MGQPTIVGSFVQKEASDGVVEVLSMPRTREILRLRFVAGLSCRQIARSIGCSRSAGSEWLKRAAVARLHWPLPEELDEAALESRLYPPPSQCHRTRRLTLPAYTPTHAHERDADAAVGGVQSPASRRTVIQARSATTICAGWRTRRRCCGKSTLWAITYSSITLGRWCQ